MYPCYDQYDDFPEVDHERGHVVGPGVVAARAHSLHLLVPERMLHNFTSKLNEKNDFPCIEIFLLFFFIIT